MVRLLKIGQPSQLKTGLSGQILEVACQPLMKASRLFLTLEGVRGVTVYGTTLNLNVTDQKAVEARVIAAARKEGIDDQFDQTHRRFPGRCVFRPGSRKENWMRNI